MHARMLPSALGWSLAALFLAACGARSDPVAGIAPTPPPVSASPVAQPAGPPTTAAQEYHPSPPITPVTLKVGTVNATSDAGIFIALERGYFAEEGVTIETETFQAAAAMIAPLGVGQLDIATGGVAAALFNAAARQVPLRIVADKGSTPSPEWDYIAFMIRKDLYDTGQIKDFSDLKGLTIANTAQGNSAEVVITKALERGGLTLADINYTLLGYPDIVTAFANRALDAAMVLEPFMSRIENQQTAVRWKGNSELHSAQQVAVIMYGPSIVEEKTEAGRRWMAAYIRGLRDYNDAFGPKRQGRDAVVQILMKHTVVKDPRDYEHMRPAGLDPDGRIKLEGLREDLTYYDQAGLVRGAVDLAQVVDTSFQEYAVQRLGPYQR